MEIPNLTNNQKPSSLPRKPPAQKNNKRKLASITAPSALPEPKNNKKKKTALRQNPKMSNPVQASTQAAQDDLPIDYAGLLVWLAEQAKNQARPLTPFQRRALADLSRSIKVEEPPLGTTDWISLLEKYRNAHNRDEGLSHTFEEESAPNGKWILTCTFKGHKDCTQVYTFPSSTHVNPVTGAVGIPQFGRKKDAKRYAAKCCIEWLISKKCLFLDETNVNVPPGAKGALFFDSLKTDDAGASSSEVLPPTPAGKFLMGLEEAAQAADGEGGAPLVEEVGTSSSTGGNQDGDKHKAPVDMFDDDASVAKRVEEVCRRLGMAQPRYVITPSSKNPEYFDGYADFVGDSCLIPNDVGRSVYICSKRSTKEAVAEKVLKRLIEIYQERMQEVSKYVDDDEGKSLPELMNEVLAGSE